MIPNSFPIYLVFPDLTILNFLLKTVVTDAINETKTMNNRHKKQRSSLIMCQIRPQAEEKQFYQVQERVCTRLQNNTEADLIIGFIYYPTN